HGAEQVFQHAQLTGTPAQHNGTLALDQRHHTGLSRGARRRNCCAVALTGLSGTALGQAPGAHGYQSADQTTLVLARFRGPPPADLPTAVSVIYPAVAPL